MKISKLLSAMPEHKMSVEINPEVELTPVLQQQYVTECSLLFICKKLNGEYSIAPDELTSRPYAILTDEDYPGGNGIPIICSENVRKSMSYAFYIESGFDPGRTRLVGITGTNGKTSTSTIVHSVLNALGIKCGHIGTGIIKAGNENLSTVGYTMTTPDVDILYKSMKEMQDRGCEVIVMEVSSHSLALDKTSPLIFEIGAFTNLSSEHMDFHFDMESYYEAKMRLFERCDSAIFNIDDAYGLRGYTEAKCEKQSLGIIERGEIYCTDIVMHGLYNSEFYYRDNKRIFKISTKLAGSFNIYNSALAMAILIKLGIPATKAKKKISEISVITGRLEVVHQSPTVIIDYAHTPIAFYNTLNTIYSALVYGQSLIVVFGCGGDRDATKRPEMGAVASKYADKIILTEDNSRSEDPELIIEDILSGIENRENVTVIHDREEAIKYALSIASANDIVAIIGKGHERYIIDKRGYRAFDEAEIIRNYFKCEDRNSAN